MKKIYIYLIIALFATLPYHLYGQDNDQVKHYYLNKNEPNATYAFTFVHITDIHIGEGEGDYGTKGYLNDTMPEGDIGYSAERLRKSVNWINENAAKNDIQFVLVTGDITDSGEKSEFDKAKEILDALKVPYVPTIGNHDIWPYVRFKNEAEYAYGDSVMAVVFKDTYDKAAQFFDNWDDGTRLQRVFNPESQQFHYHQNFSFSHKDVGFLAFDFNPRYHVRKEEPGVGAEARLNDFPGGTYDWLLNKIETHPSRGDKNLILLTHQPPHRDITALFNGLPIGDFDKMTKDLLKFKESLGLWLAGHVHRNMNYIVKTIQGGTKIVNVRETAANKEFKNGLFTLVHVYKIQQPTAVREQYNSEKISIHPNPANDVLNIHLLEEANIHQVDVYSMNGSRVYSNLNAQELGRNFTINTSDLPNGMYFIQIQGESKIYLKNFIKAK